ENYVEGPTVPGLVRSLNQPPGFETIHETGDVGTVHDELAAELDLSAAGRVIREEVEDVKLAGAQVPAREEDAAGVPKRFRRAQQLEQRGVTRAGRLPVIFHGYSLAVDCLYVNNHLCLSLVFGKK